MILVFTTIYPSPDFELKNNTNVVHSFAKEWVKQGYDVTVIYLYPVFPQIIHFFLRKFSAFFASITGKFIPSVYIDKVEEYSLDHVKVLRVPAFRLFPNSKYKNSELKKITRIVEQYLEAHDLIPRIVIGHFHYPSIEFVAYFSKLYNAKSSIVVHGAARNLKRFYKDDYLSWIYKIDIWGFRSISIKKKFEFDFEPLSKSFICRSGVPDFFFGDDDLIMKKFNDKLNYLYVGSFIRRKHPLVVLKAIHKYIIFESFNLTYVGEGIEYASLKRYVTSYNLEKSVSFLFKKSRLEISNIMKNHQCFIMISSNESFGLVYIEAMAAGCITVASRNEGMDGIIVDGVNGFLCESNNENELIEILRRINTLSLHDKIKISQNAVLTAKAYTDHKASKEYINNII